MATNRSNFVKCITSLYRIYYFFSKTCTVFGNLKQEYLGKILRAVGDSWIAFHSKYPKIRKYLPVAPCTRYTFSEWTNVNAKHIYRANSSTVQIYSYIFRVSECIEEIINFPLRSWTVCADSRILLWKLDDSMWTNVHASHDWVQFEPPCSYSYISGCNQFKHMSNSF